MSTHLPAHFQLQVSNSSAIRYIQLLDFSSAINVYCNRGTSGIDGSTSTAIGAAVQVANPVCLVTGDIGFFMIVMHFGTLIFQLILKLLLSIIVEEVFLEFYPDIKRRPF